MESTVLIDVHALGYYDSNFILLHTVYILFLPYTHVAIVLTDTEQRYA